MSERVSACGSVDEEVCYIYSVSVKIWTATSTIVHNYYILEYILATHNYMYEHNVLLVDKKVIGSESTAIYNRIVIYIPN